MILFAFKVSQALQANTPAKNTQGWSPSGDAGESNPSPASRMNITTPFPRVTTTGKDPGILYIESAPLRDVGLPQASSSCASVTPAEIKLPWHSSEAGMADKRCKQNHNGRQNCMTSRIHTFPPLFCWQHARPHEKTYAEPAGQRLIHSTQCLHYLRLC